MKLCTLIMVIMLFSPTAFAETPSFEKLAGTWTCEMHRDGGFEVGRMTYTFDETGESPVAQASTTYFDDATVTLYFDAELTLKLIDDRISPKQVNVTRIETTIDDNVVFPSVLGVSKDILRSQILQSLQIVDMTSDNQMTLTNLPSKQVEHCVRGAMDNVS